MQTFSSYNISKLNPWQQHLRTSPSILQPAQAKALKSLLNPIRNPKLNLVLLSDSCSLEASSQRHSMHLTPFMLDVFLTKPSGAEITSFSFIARKMSARVAHEKGFPERPRYRRFDAKMLEWTLSIRLPWSSSVSKLFSSANILNLWWMSMLL